MKIYDIDDIINSFGNKYSFCIALARRSRELGFYMTAKRNMERVNIIPPLADYKDEDPINIALQELCEKKVTFEKVKDDVM